MIDMTDKVDKPCKVDQVDKTGHIDKIDAMR